MAGEDAGRLPRGLRAGAHGAEARRGGPATRHGGAQGEGRWDVAAEGPKKKRIPNLTKKYRSGLEAGL